MDQTYIYGIRAVQEAVLAGQNIEKIVARKGLNGDLFASLQMLCKERNIRIQYSEMEVLNRITADTPNCNHQGVVAFMSRIKYVSLREIATDPNTPFVVMVDGITDVRNLGAIVRSADCAGATAIIVPKKGSAPINGESVKTSAGALHYLPVCPTDNPFFAVKTLKENGFRIIGVTEHGADDYSTVDYSGPIVLILGSEDKGISTQLLKLCDARACIPMHGHVESLNVSVAAGIVLFEAAKNRN